MIDTPKGFKTHPMSERARTAIFNKLSFQLSGARVADLFAGSGAIGIEALSRGAASCVFVDNDYQAVQVLRTNVATLGLETETEAFKMPVATWANNYRGELFDLIFADPPYNDLQLSSVAKATKLLKPTGQLILSTPKGQPLPQLDGLKLTDQRQYAQAQISFYQP